MIEILFCEERNTMFKNFLFLLLAISWTTRTAAMPIIPQNAITEKNIARFCKELLVQGYSKQDILDIARSDAAMRAALLAYTADTLHNGDTQLKQPKNTALCFALSAGAGLLAIALCYACIYGYAHFEESEDQGRKKNITPKDTTEQTKQCGNEATDQHEKPKHNTERKEDTQKRIETIQEETDRQKQAIKEDFQKNQQEHEEEVARLKKLNEQQEFEENRLKEENLKRQEDEERSRAKEAHKLQEEIKRKEDAARIRAEEARLKKEELEREKIAREKRLKQEYEHPSHQQNYDYSYSQQDDADYVDQGPCTIS